MTLNDTLLLYSALGGVVVAMVAIARYWMDMGATKRDAATALKKAEGASDELAKFKVDVAKDYVTMHALIASEARLRDAISVMRADVQTAISDLTKRVDLMLSFLAKPPSPK
jgi:hypothetical protein